MGTPDLINNLTFSEKKRSKFLHIIVKKKKMEEEEEEGGGGGKGIGKGEGGRKGRGRKEKKRKRKIKNAWTWISLALQWLRLCTSNAGAVGLIPGWGAKFPCALQPKNITQEQYYNKLDKDLKWFTSKIIL